jgi:hypothetical protein
MDKIIFGADFSRVAATEERPEFSPLEGARVLRARAAQAEQFGSSWALATADELREVADGLEDSALAGEGVSPLEALGRLSLETVNCYRMVAGHRWMVQNAAGLKTWLAIVTLSMAGYSQAEIADALGISRAAVCQLFDSVERSGSPLPAAIRKIAGLRREKLVDARDAGHGLPLALAEPTRRRAMAR